MTKPVLGLAVLLGCGVVWQLLRPAPIEEPPAVVLPNPNAYDFYLKAGRMHEALVTQNPAAAAVDATTDRRATGNLTAVQLARLYPRAKKDAWIETNQAVLQELRKGFNYQYYQPPQRSSLGPDPYISNLRKLARLLIIESHTKSERGDWRGATKSALDALRMGQDVARGGGWLPALVSYAIQAIACRELSKILPQLDAATARETALKMESLELTQTPLADTLREEKWIGVTNLQKYFKSYKGPAFLLSMPHGNSKQPVSRQILSNLTRDSILRNYITYMDSFIAQAAKPYALRQAPSSPFADSYLEMLATAFGNTGWSLARSETNKTQLQTRMALRAYQLDHKQFPAQLKDLLPSYLKKVPTDPYGSGEAMRYKKTSKSYLLYSIGPDKVDNGGRPILAPLSKFRPTLRARRITQPDSLGDVVAGIN